MNRLLFLALAVLALCGCGDSVNNIDITDETRNDEKNPDTGTGYYEYFLQEFILPSNIEVKCVSGEFYIDVSGDRFYTTMKDDPSYEKAKKLAEFYGDTSFCRENIPFANSPLAYPIDKITISCRKDFDAEHPAGEPLDDIVKLEFETFYEYVKNGYELPSDIPSENTKNGGIVMHLLKFEDVNADVATLVNLLPFNGQMINVTPLIHFASQPAEPGEYTFTLEMTTNGETLKTEFTHTFE